MIRARALGPLARCAQRHRARHALGRAGEAVEGLLQETLLLDLIGFAQSMDRRGARGDAQLRRGELRLQIGLVERSGPALFLEQARADELGLLVPRQERIRDDVDLVGIRSGRVQRRFDRLCREARRLLDAVEALLARGEQHTTVFDQRGAGVLVERGDAEDLHAGTGPFLVSMRRRSSRAVQVSPSSSFWKNLR